MSKRTCTSFLVFSPSNI